MRSVNPQLPNMKSTPLVQKPAARPAARKITVALTEEEFDTLTGLLVGLLGGYTGKVKDWSPEAVLAQWRTESPDYVRTALIWPRETEEQAVSDRQWVDEHADILERLLKSAA